MNLGNFVQFALALTLTGTASSAFATHAYRSEDCVSKTLQLHYKGSHLVGGSYGIAPKGIDVAAKPDDELIALLTEEYEGALSEGDVFLTTKSSHVVGKSVKSTDCGFDHEEWASRTVYKIDKASAKATKLLGIKPGAEIVFVCKETSDMPNGNECN